MRYLKPHYYDKFVCTAGDCPDSCCAGWQIMIDETSLERVKSVFLHQLRKKCLIAEAFSQHPLGSSFHGGRSFLTAHPARQSDRRG